MSTTTHMRRFVAAGALSLAVLASLVGPASAAHNGNNRAEITGKADADATGQAIVNYSEGRSDFNGTITVANLTPGATYRFFVRSATGVETLICLGVANSQGVFTCNAQHLKLGGFGRAVVRDAAGVEVASGAFDRRGNCRDPEQGGSLCEAPGHSK